MRYLLLISLAVLFPGVAQANIYISEVAWMGSAESANHEWIELHNTGSDISVDNWTIVDDNNLSIELAGTIPANSYVVLERTSEDSAPGQSFLIYTGALVNSGATLILSRDDGSVVDRVSGGSDWQNIGGNNDTKETAQYSKSGWVTETATPGSSSLADKQTKSETTNQTPEEEDDQVDQTDQSSESNQATTDSSQSNQSSGGSSKSEPLKLPPVGLQLSIEAPDTGYVNQPINFVVEPSGIGDTLIASLSYQWNFGNGKTSSKKSPTQLFRYPGTYVVNVFANYERQEALARHKITVLPVNLSITQNSAGDIQINNDSAYEVDISGYRLNSQDNFTFPPRTIILPNQTITINQKQINHDDHLMLAIYDNGGDMLTSVLPEPLLAYADISQSETETASQPTSVPKPNNNFTFTNDNNSGLASDESSSETTSKTRDEIATNSPAVASVASPGLTIDDNWTYLALILIVLIASAGVLIKPKSN